MTNLQFYIYCLGCVFFVLGCLFYYLKSNKNLSSDQIKIRSLIMNVFLTLAFISIVLSFINFVPVAQ